ncbi:MAG: YceD family protein [Jeotgalicoccus sp.]
MKWSLSQIRKYASEKFTFDETVQLDTLLDRADILAIEDVKIYGDMFFGLHRVDVDLHISAVVKMIDSRSGDAVSLPLEIQSVEVFDETLEEDDETEDDNLHPLVHTLDLEPVVRELLIVNLPTVYTESDELPGSSGASGWTVMDEAEASGKKPAVDPRLQKLEALKLSDEEE